MHASEIESVQHLQFSINHIKLCLLCMMTADQLIPIIHKKKGVPAFGPCMSMHSKKLTVQFIHFWHSQIIK